MGWMLIIESIRAGRILTRPPVEVALPRRHAVRSLICKVAMANRQVCPTGFGGSVEMRPKESSWKKFARQTDPAAIKFKYRHCLIPMPVFFYFNAYFTDTRKWVRWLRPDSARNEPSAEDLRDENAE